MDLQPVTLHRQYARLEPLGWQHFDGIARYIADPTLWQYMSFGSLDTSEKLRGWMERAIEEAARGESLPFAIVDAASGQAVGSTSAYDISREHKRLEIGRTWIGRPFQRTGINTECKYLLFRHCFRTLGCNRVQLKTDSRNLQSQQAIERIGAVREGVLRAHMVLPDGFVRDTVMYSIIAREWPRVRQKLEFLMTR